MTSTDIFYLSEPRSEARNDARLKHHREFILIVVMFVPLRPPSRCKCHTFYRVPQNNSTSILSIMTIQTEITTQALCLSKNMASIQLMSCQSIAAPLKPTNGSIQEPFDESMTQWIGGGIILLPQQSESLFDEKKLASPIPDFAIPKPATKRIKKRVEFSTVEIREYALVVGDHVGVTLPLSLDWSYDPQATVMTVSTHEELGRELRDFRRSTSKSTKAFLPPPQTTMRDRIRRLKLVSSYTDKELYVLEMERRSQHKAELYELQRKQHEEIAQQTAQCKTTMAQTLVPNSPVNGIVGMCSKILSTAQKNAL